MDVDELERLLNERDHTDRPGLRSGEAMALLARVRAAEGALEQVRAAVEARDAAYANRQNGDVANWECANRCKAALSDLAAALAAHPQPGDGEGKETDENDAAIAAAARAFVQAERNVAAMDAERRIASREHWQERSEAAYAALDAAVGKGR